MRGLGDPTEGDEASDEPTDKLLKWTYCVMLVQEIPNASVGGVANSPFWNKLVSIITQLKQLMVDSTN
jgi:hypothetical protein